jgi:hypothetical protein
MALDNPIDAYLRAAQVQNQNRVQANQDLGSIGQGLGQGMSSIGQMVQEHKKKQVLQQLMQAMRQQGQPQQGPPLPGVGMGMKGQQPPASGMGASSPDQSSLINSLMMQLDPESGIKAMYEQQDPYKRALTAQVNAETQAKLRPPKPANVFKPFGESPSQTGLLVDESTGEIKDTGVKVAPKKNQDSLDAKETARQDRLAKEYRDRVQKVVGARTGGLGMQDQKVDQAIHLRSMVNQSWNPQTKTYELPEMQQGELVMGLANLVSGSQVSNIEQLKAITPKTARGDMAHLISYWSGTPVTNQPQEMIKNLVTSIDRQGQVSEKLRDKYVKGLKNLRPKGLNQEEGDNIEGTELTSSFSDILKESPDQGSGPSSGGLTPQEQAEFRLLDAKYGGKR